MLARIEKLTEPLQGVVLRSVQADEFLEPIALHYFGTPVGCRSVTDDSGRTEPLIDDVWEAQQKGEDAHDTRFVMLVSALVRQGAEFVCWCSSDYTGLPTVGSWEEFERELMSQTAAQPADFFVHFRPPADIAPKTTE